jgi:hypothetical protein
VAIHREFPTSASRFKNAARTDSLLSNWLRKQNTVEFLGIGDPIQNLRLFPANSLYLKAKSAPKLSL